MKKNLFIVSILLTLYCVKNEGFGQTAVFDHFSNEDGLLHNTVRKIIQDEKGYIWLATFGGINKFNGIDFKVYNSSSHKNPLPDDDVTSMVYDSKRKCIWTGTNKGLAKIDLITDSVKSYSSELLSNDIRALYLDDKNNLWIGTKSTGLYLYTKNKFRHIATPNVRYIKTIYIDSSGRLWIGSTSDGIASIKFDGEYEVSDYKLYDESLKTYPDPEAPLVYFFYETSENVIYIGTRVGLYYFDENLKEIRSFSFTNQNDGFDDFADYYRCIMKDSQGYFWIGTYDGIFKFKTFDDFRNNNYEHFYHEERVQHSLTDNLVSDIIEDKSGVIWVGMEHGLGKYDPYKNQFRLLVEDIFYQQRSNAAACFSETRNGELLIGGIYNGLVMKRGGKYFQILDVNKRICSITSKDGANFWIGTWNGDIIHYDYNTNEFAKYNLSAVKSPIFTLKHIDKNTLIIGTHGEGVLFFDINERRVIKKGFLKQYSFPDNINTIYKCLRNDFWIGSDNGLIRINFEKESIVKFEADNSSLSLPHNSVLDVINDKEGDIWIATRGGICYISVTQNGEYNFQFVEELKTEWATNIIVDKSNTLWFNINNNKIFSYDKTNGIIKKFSVPNGTRSNLQSKRGFYYWSDSLIYVGGTHEVFTFIPSKISTFNMQVEPTLSELRIHNKIVIPGEKLNDQVVLNRDFSYTKNISLNYDNNNFAISFFSPNYTNVKGLGYRYRLSPFENKWKVISNNQQPQIQYTNIPPGDYIFEVCSRNADGIWSRPRLLEIKIAPPLWRSNLAIIIYVILVTVVFYFSRHIIAHRIKLKNELMLEKVKSEKEEMLLQDKLRFFTNISHELKTPLTLIIGPLKQLLLLKLKPELQEQHRLIYKNSTRLRNLVNQILDFRKAEAGKLRLKVTETDILEYTKNIYTLFLPIAKEKFINYEFICESDNIIGWIDKDKYDKIIFNLLSNAFKYTNKKGNIVLKLEVIKNENEKFVKVSVKDNGRGIPKEFQENIFLRFFQVPSKESSNTGTGIGLALVKNFVSIHKGEIWLNSEPDVGSKFTIKIPIDKQTYAQSEIFTYAKKEDDLSSQYLGEEAATKNELDDSYPKLLVIEDNAELRAFVKSIFLSLFYVLEAENGLKGLAQAKKHHPVLVIADVMMDEMDGFEFCKKLKSSPDISHIPVVLLTALGEDTDIVTGYKLGADDYISKPFDPVMLKTRITSIISNRNLLQKKFSSEVNTNLHILSNSPADDNLFDKIQKIIEDNISNPELNLKLLCTELNMSQSKLYKKLGAISSLTPNEFIQTFRLKKAAQLLKEDTSTISEVAYNVGFNDPLYFSKCFRKRFDISPSEYRKN